VPPIRKITLLFHERHRGAERLRYRVWAMAEHWKARGVRMATAWGLGDHGETDLLFPHLELSWIPDDYWALLQSRAAVVNRHVRDIRKPVFSTCLLARGDDYDGAVIVKTACNCGGRLDELLLGPNRRGIPLARTMRRIARIAWVERRRLGRARTLGRYHIFPSSRAVPDAAFDNPHLVVERFVPERRGERFVLRMCHFFGDRHSARVMTSTDPQVKSWNARLEERIEPPEAVLELRARLRLDYGKIDYVVRDGMPIVLDVNTTPTMSSPLDAGAIERSAALAAGLSWFER